MESSRIFVKGLPPTFTDSEFRKHFSQKGTITDAKIFPNRRIGYVGYKTPEEAQKAVKYFNRTFIRMSKIGVELARPVEETKSASTRSRAPTAAQPDHKAHEPPQDAGALKRKRDDEPQEEQNPKLKEFLDIMRPKSKKKAWEIECTPDAVEAQEQDVASGGVSIPAGGESDEEYEEVLKTRKEKPNTGNHTLSTAAPAISKPPDHDVEDAKVEAALTSQPVVTNTALSDADWARSRTSRLLGLLDEDEEDAAEAAGRQQTQDEDDEDESEDREEEQQLVKHDSKTTAGDAPAAIPTPPAEAEEVIVPLDADLAAVRESMRLFVRNLPYDVKREDLEAEFTSFGNLEEVHISVDKRTGLGKGFAFVQYSDPDSAEQALIGRDGQTFQGRLLHILPATTKRDTRLDDFALSKLPLKKQQEIKRRREATSSTFNWNALYMNVDAVVSSVADRLGLSKSEVLDPTSSDAAVKQAHAETHIIQETKSYFRKQGIDLESFKKSQRGDTAILVKNIPYDCSKDELKRLFEEQGDVKKFLMPPSGVIAIVEFANAAQCKAAFGALAYRKLKSSMLFLEKAPKDLFASGPIVGEVEESLDGVNKVSISDLKDVDQVVPDTAGTATLFVRNLNFTTTTQILTETFKPLDGFLSARVKTKTDAKKPGQILSMGFGFLEFSSSKQAQTALQVMDGYTLEGHKLQIRASHKGADAAEERKKADAQKRAASQGTKVIIKNLPFQATKKDVRALFGAYGQLRSVRVPKKMDNGARGFAFADFTTTKEAQNAMESLRDTHLLGRRLVLDFAAGEPEDAEAEIEKMQQKVGAQVNKVALQKLTSGGRKKFTTQNDEDEG